MPLSTCKYCKELIVIVKGMDECPACEKPLYGKPKRPKRDRKDLRGY